MLYHLFEWFQKVDIRFPGIGLFQFITFRALLAILLSLFITMVFGKRVILFLQNKQVGESVRELGLQGEENKKGTPTMGGFIILLGILIPTLLFANLDKVYIKLLLLSTVWLGIIGFIDDYLKLRAKKISQELGIQYRKGDKDGLAGWFKVLGQVGLGIIISATLLLNENTKVMREYKGTVKPEGSIAVKYQGGVRYFVKANEPITTIPFIKNHEFNYSKLLPSSLRSYGWVLYMLVIIFIVTAVSNGANITDGLDGLATGVSAIIGVCLALFAYASGNLLLADYLNIMYIPNLGEVSIFIAALIGACIGFLWYNTFPAQVFMGDTGSLALGGIIASIAIMVRKELMIPIFCAVFLIENVSVMIQVGYFKYTKRKYGEGRRVFLMSPLHHHYQKKGYHESKIAVRFWIVTLLFVVVAILSLKIR
ncbi:MAG: phospho-N-acetylmuramoyl-pentapeptide-transferase [Chitinophagaceae bacterium]|nr:MAG: phospho-N-acetylmuramoyl-pentapeptide-transferase [Chitinophagaceae bacterium]